MDYTKNYHLPQWEKSDRIMMEDFNQMCVDMEEGLTAGAEKTAELDTRLEEVKATAETAPDVFGTFTFLESSVGRAVETFDFEPSFVLLLATNSFAVGGRQGAAMTLYTGVDASKTSKFHLDGKNLLLLGYNGGPRVITFAAFR